MQSDGGGFDRIADEPDGGVALTDGDGLGMLLIIAKVKLPCEIVVLGGVTEENSH